MTGNAVANICCVVLLAALVQAQNDECFDAMKCTSAEAKKAIINRNHTEMCRMLPAIIECLDGKNKLCNDASMAQTNAQHSNSLKKSLADCGGYATRPTTAVVKVSVKECAARFMSCDVQEVQKVTMDKDDAGLVCKTFTDVTACLEDALAVCPETDDQNVPQMFGVLERMREQFVSLKCTRNPEPESSRYDSASSLATSIIQTCIALLLVTLLH
ncbi:hypothetical protein BsWGS_08107 [Bradybaena similaris]